ncbi:MAG: hypothetical protein ACRDQW_09080 [Haloechinothrix sp.]
MTKLRGLALTLLLVGVLCALVPVLGLSGPAEIAVPGRPATAAKPSPVSLHKPQEPERRKAPERADPQPSQPEPGPRIDPEDNERANSERTKNKLIVGGVSVVLLGVVVWGRRVRSHRRQKARA